MAKEIYSMKDPIDKFWAVMETLLIFSLDLVYT